MGTYYVGNVSFNGDDAIKHYRTKGSKNGVSTTPGYKAIGELAGKASKETVPLVNMIRNHKLPSEYQGNRIKYRARNSSDLFDSTEYTTIYSSTFSSPSSSGKDKHGGLSRNRAYQNSGRTIVTLNRGKLSRAYDSGKASINKVISSSSNWTSKAVKDVGDWGSNAVADGKKWLKNAGNAVGKAANDAGNWTSKAAKDVGDWGGNAINEGKKFFKRIFG